MEVKVTGGRNRLENMCKNTVDTLCTNADDISPQKVCKLSKREKIF